MQSLIENPKIIEILKNPPKILIIEGPDGVGKSFSINQMDGILSRTHEVHVLRFPDNRGDIGLRTAILESDMSRFNLGMVFLFLADFVNAYEQYIRPHLNDPEVIFIFDRFIPSSCIYQKVTIDWINRIFSLPQFHDFFETMMTAQYLYLIPSDMNSHKKRLAQKKGDELNILDPVGDEQIQRQIINYREFMLKHITQKLLGSDRVTEISVP